jgi:hypothetical protein
MTPMSCHGGNHVNDLSQGTVFPEKYNDRQAGMAIAPGITSRLDQADLTSVISSNGLGAVRTVISTSVYHRFACRIRVR